MTDQTVHVYPTVEDLQRSAAEQIGQALRPTTEGQTMTIALSGGSTPRRMHELLAEQPHIDWSNVHVFWGDERTVPPDHPDSNYRMALETLLRRVPIPEQQIHRMAGEKDPTQAAAEYEQELRDVFGVSPPELPRFDVIVLGVGADAHTASLFPGTRALEERQRYVVANDVPQLDTTRLTLTLPVLNAAKLVMFLGAGADKAEAVESSLSRGENVPPAGQVRPTEGQSRWLLDAEAAARLTAGE